MIGGVKPVLRIGSVGPVVAELQRALNQLPTKLARLADDGDFGSKTRQRVVEFQGQNKLSQDGVVGPMTWEKLLALIQQYGAGIVEAVIAPEDETAARERIVNIAKEHLTVFGGFDPKLHMGSPRIAGSLCANPLTRARQGGAALAAIFTTAGVAAAAKCPTISVQAEKMYQRSHTAQERNAIDIPSWCGIFALHCCKLAGLKLSPWPLRWTPGAAKASDEFRLLKPGEKPMKGDLGIKLIVGGKTLNHHFVVVEASASGVSSIDGNAGMFQQILPNSYTVNEVYAAKGGFLRPIWEKVL